jgi:hypothetical protein
MPKQCLVPSRSFFVGLVNAALLGGIAWGIVLLCILWVHLGCSQPRGSSSAGFQHMAIQEVRVLGCCESTFEFRPGQSESPRRF